MPIEKHIHLQPKGEIGIWRKQEDLAFFKDHLELHEAEQIEIKALNYRKLSEWYSSRYLLHELSGRKKRGACLKDKYGKPYLLDSDFFISMSHSRDLVAVIAYPSACGVDIQYLVPKITRIAKKFVNTTEEGFIRNEQLTQYLHVIWGAKECIYKAYGKRGLDFRKQMAIHPFKINHQKEINTIATLYLNNETREFYITAQINEEYVLVYALENNEPLLVSPID